MNAHPRQTPSRPAYHLPESGVLGPAVTYAIAAAGKAHERLGRVMVVVTAAAVRDILTGAEEGAPFDAARVELIETVDGCLFPTGRYWTTAGDERTFADAVGEVPAACALHDMSEWTTLLDQNNREVWHPLCSELPDCDGRPAFSLDLIRAAATPFDAPPLPPACAARAADGMVDVMVCANDRDRYPARIDPADQRDGYVKPWFDLDTVRRIAADTEAGAARYGHGSIDTVHVLDGTVDGAGHVVVLVVCWMHLGGEKHQEAVEVCQPNADGRYAIGGHDWCWYALDDDLNPVTDPTGL